VEIVIGKDRRSRIVHVEALRSCKSPSLTALLEKYWAEWHGKVIDWTEHDGDTVDRFLMFLYYQDYASPDPVAFSPEGNATTLLEAPPLAPEQAAETELLEEESPPVQDAFQTRSLTPIDRCLDVGLPVERRLAEAGRFEELPFLYSGHYYLGVLLAHARVYTFAQYHFVTRLQELALQRMTQTLKRIDCQQAHAASEVTALIRHLYQNTISQESVEDPARKLVSQFAAIHYHDLFRGEFETLLSECGEFALDVGRKIWRRLSMTMASTKILEEQIDRLEDEVRELKKAAEIQNDELLRLRPEVTEGHDWKTRKFKKGIY
jgi:hypothetical protein